ncbi:hypothetical protein AO398_00065 [Methylobacterium sp. GXS13]|uniref:hypothetical protein n=1 Tax=Methylobacterium sp. GXS13 TaxID=1730094 RepID=UPI00071B1D11|nr:hypothetical protein [Methylobacterium sp. GXS13]KST61121.1 hypothetical protein AO398_00065 [Methylobacterium sp. GXS13]
MPFTSISEPSVAERRAAERDRRIAIGRAALAEAAPSGQTLVAEAGRRVNGAPPDVDAAAELRAIGQMLYGRRWTTELAEDLGEDPRQIRRWLSGEARVPPRVVAWARDEARKRAREILRLVGEA